MTIIHDTYIYTISVNIALIKIVLYLLIYFLLTTVVHDNIVIPKSYVHSQLTSTNVLSKIKELKSTYKANYKLQVTNWLISRYASKTRTLRWLFYSAFLSRNGSKTSSTIRVLKSLINLVYTLPKGCKMVSTCFECFEYLFTYGPSTSCKIWDKSNEPVVIKNCYNTGTDKSDD